MLFLFQRQILPVQAFVKFLLGGVADRNDFYLEVQGLACKLVVEVHGNGVFLNLGHCTLDDLTVLVEHGNDGADLQQVFAEHSANFEGTLRNVELQLRIHGAVAFFGADGDAELFAGFMAFEALFESGNHHMCPVDVLQRLSLGGFVHLLSFYSEAVCDCYDFVLLDFHFLVFLFNYISFCFSCSPYANRAFLHTTARFSCSPYANRAFLHTGCRYPLKSTLSNARVGVSLARQRRASAPAARSCDQSVTILPVISISRTGCTIFPSLKR